MTEHHQSRPPLRSSRQDEDEDKGYALHFQSISEPMGSETSVAVDGIRERLREFGPNFRPSFYATPNTGIWVQILGLILYIQMRCNCILTHLNCIHTLF
jgi:hypothetical protein